MNDLAAAQVWIDCARNIAVVVFLLTGFAVLFQWLVKTPAWRRLAWQTCFAGFLLATAVTVTGLSSGFREWIAAPSANDRVHSHLLPPSSERIATATMMERSLPVSAETIHAAPIVSVSQRPAPHRWPAVLWLTGTLLVFLKMTATMVVLIHQRQKTAPDQAQTELVRDLCRRIGFQRSVSLIETPGLSTPIAFGIVRPTIALPAGFSTRFSPRQQEVMLAHELAHLSAHDPFWHLISDLTTALLWWNPLVWWSRRQLHTAGEQAADQASLVVENGPATLAECLVEIAGRLARAKTGGGIGISGSGFKSGLGRRVERLLDGTARKWSPPRRSPALLARLCGGVATLALAVAVCSASNEQTPAAQSSLGQVLMKGWRQSPASLLVAQIQRNPGREPDDAAQEATAIPSQYLQTGMFRVERQSTPDAIAPGQLENVQARVFHVDPGTFLQGLESRYGPALPSQDGQSLAPRANELRMFLSEMGIPLQPPKMVFFNERLGMILARATPEELLLVEHALEVLNAAPAQIVIESLWIEVHNNTAGNETLDWLTTAGAILSTNHATTYPTAPRPTPRIAILSTNHAAVATAPVDGFTTPVSNSIVAPISGTLPHPRFRELVRKLEERGGAEILTTPSVTTLSGRQARISSVDMTTVVTGLETVTGEDGISTNHFQTRTIPFGSVLDVIPVLAPDGRTIRLEAAASVTEFLGYDDSREAAGRIGETGVPLTAAIPLPRIRSRQMTATALVAEGRTLVISGLPGRDTPEGARSPGRLFLFITPYQVDPAGNRLHPD